LCSVFCCCFVLTSSSSRAGFNSVGAAEQSILLGLQPSTECKRSFDQAFGERALLAAQSASQAVMERAVRLDVAPSADFKPRRVLPAMSAAQERLAERSVLYAGSLCEARRPVSLASHTRFSAIALPEIEDAVIDLVPSTAWLDAVEPPERCLDGNLGRFPWLQQHRGQVYCAPRARNAAHPLDRLVNLGLDNASADGKRGATHTGVRAFHAFCVDEMRTTPARPMDVSAPLWAKLQEEMLAMRFVCSLIEVRGVSVRSAANYWSAVQGNHLREHGVKIGGGLKFERLPQMLKGLRRALGDPERAVRRGIAPQALRKAMDLCLDPDDPNDANVRAALAVALQGLLRSSEFALDPSKVWNKKRHVSRGDIVELLDDRLTLMIAPCKNGNHLAGKTCALVIGGGGEFIDAVAEVKNMLRVDPVRDGQNPFDVPLFRIAATVEPLRTDAVRATVRKLMQSIGENPEQFGTHSLRIGGATALFAAGADETVIRTMGRWSSDIHQLYVRACFERCCEWTRRAGSTVVTDVARVFDEVDFY
jgi:hypothetical protein